MSAPSPIDQDFSRRGRNTSAAPTDLPMRGSRRSRVVNSGFSRVSGPLMAVAGAGLTGSRARMLTAMRPSVNRALVSMSPVPSGTRVHSVRSSMPTGSVRGEWVTGSWVRAGARAEQRIIYYLHGSGYVVCSARTHRGVVARLSRRTGLPAFSLDYRLGPEYRFPAAGDDAIRGYRWLLSEGFKPENIVIAGDSAGGHLALDVLADNQRAGLGHPSHMVLFSPLYDPTFDLAVDLQRRGVRDPHIEAVAAQRILRLYTGDADGEDPRMRISLEADPDLPRTFIQVGAREVMADDARTINRLMTDAGTTSELQEWADQGHVFQMFPYFSADSRNALSQAGRFMGSMRE